MDLRENLIVSGDSVVARNLGVSTPLDAGLEKLDTSSRLLWLRPDVAGPLRSTGRHFAAISAQLLAMDVDGDGRVCAGEFRNFLWNLHLSDEDFELIWQRFAPGRGAHLLTDDVLFLLGRPHALHPEVPVDALIYEAVVSILGRRTTAHIDKDLSDEDRGIGCALAFRLHWPSYCFTLFLQIGALVSVVIAICGGEQVALAVLGICVFAYLIQVMFFVRLTAAFHNRTEGMEEIISLMDRPRWENPHYRWHVQCYHMETRTFTETTRNSDGTTTTRTKTKTVRVDTYSASASGVIPSIDQTFAYVPQTAAQQTQIHTDLDLDFSGSNYVSKFHRWAALHRRDVLQDRSHQEDLPSRKQSVLAVWRPGSRKWWMNSTCYWLSNLLCCSLCFRWYAQSHLGEQTYVYRKRCFDI
mmetsp:Transcript_46503/g.133926  ORF Transcript_46503/g.133926 Transcript_46503/m.133926 type:complete len:412 (+) Transcript_46503:1-1236(+)